MSPPLLYWGLVAVGFWWYSRDGGSNGDSKQQKEQAAKLEAVTSELEAADDDAEDIELEEGDIHTLNENHVDPPAVSETISVKEDSMQEVIPESMQKLLEKNDSLETSLLSANTELEGSRVKSKSLEDFCQLLNDERSSFLTERSSLVSRLEYVEKKLESLETRFTKLEDKYTYLEMEKVSILSQVEELKVSLVVERKERASLVLISETRLSGLEDRVENLQQENMSREKEFEEQVEKAVNALVEIFIMPKFMQDVEQKDYSLLVECQKHAETARYSEKRISELENENMMNQLMTEFLLDRMAKLRSGVCQLLKAFEIGHLSDPELENLLSVVLGNVKSVKTNLLKNTDDNYKLLVENNVLTALVQQLNLEGLKLASCKEALDQEFSLLNQKNVFLEQENSSLMAQTRQL